MRTNCFTKLVCTIGPASESPEVITEMLLAGMSVARLNFSHGEFDWHGTMIRRLRECAAKVGRSLAILADLPGVKIRVGCMKEEGVQIVEGSTLILTTEEVEGDTKRIQISLKKLPSTLKPGDQVFINDGIPQGERLLKLNKVAITQMRVLVEVTERQVFLPEDTTGAKEEK